MKQKAIKEYGKFHNAKILVETGTFRGDMIHAQKNNFKKIYSIELNESLYNMAVKRFNRQKHIKIYLGDSSKTLKEIIPELDEKSVFWLDAHYSGGVTSKGDKESPILEELKIILSSKINHVILIDDAREFIGERDYPSIEELKKFIFKKNPDCKIEIKNDLIRIIL